MNLSVQLASRHSKGLLLANPVITASGTFGYGTENSHLFDIQRLGAIICKGTTLQPREGNPQPRLAETACGMLNSIGLQNIGVDALIREKAPVWAKWRVPVIVNIAGESVEDYAEIARRLDGVAGVSGIEVNVSCPNVKAGCDFGADPSLAAEVTAAIRKATSLPVLVKLTPNTTDIVSVATAVAEAGADAISLINTLRGMAIDLPTRRPLLGNVTGGLSGPAIKPVALYMVYQVAGAVKSIPIVGCGGITTVRDAIEFIMAGASAVEVGTAGFANPRAALDIIEGIEQFMEKEGVKDINELVGVARGFG